MTSYTTRIRPYVAAELLAADQAEAQGQPAVAFTHLERAHVLGQPSTVEHVRVHWRMFVWGWRRRSLRECLGQVVRIGGAATKTAIGLVPAGNTGGANINPFKRLPIPPDLAAVIERVKGSSDSS